MAGDSILGRAKIPIVGDLSQLDKDLSEARGKVASAASTIGDSFKKAALAGGLAIVGGVALVAKGLRECVGPASDLNESMSKVNVVFGDSADEMIDWSKTAATAMGMSQQKALEAAGTYGNLFSAMGLTTDESVEMSQGMTQLAADLASFNNIPVADALEKLRAGLTGEAEPLKALGINMNEATLKAKALEMGLISSTKEALTPAAKAQAAYALIMEQSALAQGDFARTSDGLANQQKILGAQFEDIKAKIGTALLPALTTLSGKFTEALADPKVQEAIQKVADWIAVNLPKAIEGLVAFIEDPLIPVIGKVVSWLEENVPKAVETAGNIFEWLKINVLTPLWEFIQDPLIPIIEKIWDWLKVKVPEAVNKAGEVLKWIKEKVLEPVYNAFKDIIDVIGDVIQWFSDLWAKIQEGVGLLPDWLVPGSPTPFELGLRGIASAMRDLSTIQFPALGGQLTPAMAGLEDGGAIGGGGPVSITFQVERMDVSSVAAAETEARTAGYLIGEELRRRGLLGRM
jgi:hypothetical protein